MGSLSCKQTCWAIAGAIGLLTFILLVAITGLGIFGALLLGLLAAGALGVLLQMALCTDSIRYGTAPGAYGGTAQPPEAAPAAPVAASAKAAGSKPKDAAQQEPELVRVEGEHSFEPSTNRPADAEEVLDTPNPDAKPTVEPGGDGATGPALAAGSGAPGQSGAGDPLQDDPAPVAATTADGETATTKPKLLEKPRDGGADDLKEIRGVGPKLEGMLHDMGIYHFDQIASWSDAELAWVDENLDGFRGRARRDDWVAQARTLASGEETEFSKKVQKGGVYEN